MASDAPAPPKLKRGSDDASTMGEQLNKFFDFFGEPRSPAPEAEPLLGRAESGMDDCCGLPVRPACLGFDTVDCVARPAATIALQYGTVYFLDYYDDSCTSFGETMYVVLAVTLEVAGLAAVWYDVPSAFPPTLTWINRAQSSATRPRYAREFFSLLFLMLYLLSVLSFALVAYVVTVFYVASDSEAAAKDLFKSDC